MSQSFAEMSPEKINQDENVVVHQHNEFICTICNRRLATSVKLSVHMLIHSKKFLYQSVYGQQRFKRKRDVKIHIDPLEEKANCKEKQKLNRYEPETKEDEQNRLDNFVQHNDNSQTEMEHNGTGFRNQDTPIAAEHDNVKKDNCSENVERTFKEDNLEMSRNKIICDEKDLENQRGRFVCGTCQKRFKTSSKLKRHMISHSEGVGVKCIFCQTTHKNKQCFISHMKTLHLMTLEDIEDYLQKQELGQESLTITTTEYKGKQSGNSCEKFATRKDVELSKGTSKIMGTNIDDQPCAEHGNSEKNLIRDQNGPIEEVATTCVNQNVRAKEKVQYLCNICGQRYYSRLALRFHMRQVHRQKKRNRFFCGVCHKNFASTKTLKMHLYSHRRDIRYDCTICGKSCLSKRSLLYHERSHKRTDHDETAHRNKISNISIELNSIKKDNLEEQEEKKNAENYLDVFPTIVEEQYLCFDCGDTFNAKCSLVEHIKLHLGIKAYKCQICRETFNTASYLKRHSRIHSGDSVYSCDRCGESFPDHKFLKEHIIYDHGEKALTCKFCRKVFTEEAWNEHMKMHRTEDNRCEVCGVSFRRRGYLDRHMASHSDKRPHKCDMCYKTYKSYAYLRKHISSHRKIFKQCHVCGKSVIPNCFNQHMKSHTDVKTFQCEVCSKFFKMKHQLKSHLLTHDYDDSARKHECEICGFKFKMAHHLRSHLKRIHKENCLNKQISVNSDKGF